jgi:hypothetical protein
VICPECDKPIKLSGRDPIVFVRFETRDGESLTTARVPMHLTCAAQLAVDLESRGWSSAIR